MTEPSDFLANDFPSVSYDEWSRQAAGELEALAEVAARSTAAAGITRRPLYAARDRPRPDPGGFPGQPPFVRGTSARPHGWEVAQEYPIGNTSATPADLCPVLAEDLESGVERIVLRLATGERPGLVLAAVKDLEELFSGRELGGLAVELDAGATAPAAAALLVAWADRQGQPARLDLAYDPLAALAAGEQLVGGLETAWRQAADLLTWSREARPASRVLGSSAVGYHLAGANPVQELALAIAGGVETLRRLQALGQEPAVAAPAMVLSFAVSGELFLEIAKLRAARLLWAKVARACGAGEAAPRIHARTSAALRARREPLNNQLRATAETFAAAAGGAEVIVTAPYDEALGLDGGRGRRTAIHTQHVLREEAHLARVLDPAGGSYAVEAWTEELARAAWALFQEIEGRGGLGQSLVDGWVGELLASTAAERHRAIRARQPAFVGVSEFPDLEADLPAPPSRPRPVASRRRNARGATAALTALSAAAGRGEPDGTLMRAAIAAAEAGAVLKSIHQASQPPAGPAASSPLRMAALPAWRPMERFERLLERASRWRGAAGRSARVFVAQIGKPETYRAQAAALGPLFAAGGMETVEAGPQPLEEHWPRETLRHFAESGAEFAVICADPETYSQILPILAPALLFLGTCAVMVAGSPGPEEHRWREAGVSDFIGSGCDAAVLLEALWDTLGG